MSFVLEQGVNWMITDSDRHYLDNNITAGWPVLKQQQHAINHNFYKDYSFNGGVICKSSLAVGITDSKHPN
jgi:hypothetical protein